MIRAYIVDRESNFLEEFKFSYRSSDKSFMLSSKCGTEEFRWNFFENRLFEVINLLLESKHEIYSKSGYFIERMIIHE
jgi:hypothetical protein